MILLEQDCGAWDVRPQKYWAQFGAIEIWRIPAWELPAAFARPELAVYA